MSVSVIKERTREMSDFVVLGAAHTYHSELLRGTATLPCIDHRDTQACEGKVLSDRHNRMQVVCNTHIIVGLDIAT